MKDESGDTSKSPGLGASQADSREDIAALENALDAAEQEARSLVAGLTEELAAWRTDAGSWSVAECLDHLAIANRIYLTAMTPVAERALRNGRRRRRPAVPGMVGGWFVRLLEPPVKPLRKGRAPRIIRPRAALSLNNAIGDFIGSQNEVRAFLRRFADVDLAGVHFPNPFVRGVRFSLATGLHVIGAHERRHLWQARRVRQAAESSDLSGDQR